MREEYPLGQESQLEIESPFWETNIRILKKSNPSSCVNEKLKNNLGEL